MDVFEALWGVLLENRTGNGVRGGVVGLLSNVSGCIAKREMLQVLVRHYMSRSLAGRCFRISDGRINEARNTRPKQSMAKCSASRTSCMGIQLEYIGIDSSLGHLQIDETLCRPVQNASHGHAGASNQRDIYRNRWLHITTKTACNRPGPYCLQHRSRGTRGRPGHLGVSAVCSLHVARNCGIWIGVWGPCRCSTTTTLTVEEAEQY